MREVILNGGYSGRSPAQNTSRTRIATLEANILVLCPNHHSDFDFGMLSVDPETLEVSHQYEDSVDGRTVRTIPEHEVDPNHIRYHNANL